MQTRTLPWASYGQRVGKVQCDSSNNLLQISRKLRPSDGYVYRKKFRMLNFTTNLDFTTI